MDDIRSIKNNDERVAPLHRFLEARKERDGNTTSQTTTANVGVGEPQGIPGGHNGRTQRRPSGTSGYGTRKRASAQHAKPRRNDRPGKGKSGRPGRKVDEDHTISGITRKCRCGAEAESPYFQRCEDCFAEDSERWNGKDQSAMIHF